MPTKLTREWRVWSKQSLKQFVIEMQKNGMSVCEINSYARSLNSFLSWLYKEGYVSEPLRLALLKEQRRAFKPLTDQQLKSFFCMSLERLGSADFTLFFTLRWIWERELMNL